MPATYEPIATTTLGSAATAINFSSIPATYTDLRVIFRNGDSQPSNTHFRLNTDSGSNYSFTSLNGNGTSATSDRNTNSTTLEINTSNGSNAFLTLDFFNYAGSTFKTSLITLSNDSNGTGYVIRQVGLWRSTAAITSINFRCGGAGTLNFPIGTTATLYGILKA
jgi:hypothetical protein